MYTCAHVCMYACTHMTHILVQAYAHYICLRIQTCVNRYKRMSRIMANEPLVAHVL